MLRHLILLGACVFSIRNGLASWVEEWNIAFEQSVQAETTPPALAARNLAILHWAMHDAWAVCEAPDSLLDPSLRPLISDPQKGGGSTAAVTAAREACLRLFPSRSAAFEKLFETHRESVLKDGFRPEAVMAGRRIAAAVFQKRESDGSTTTVHYVPKTGDHQWRRTTRNRPPELPHWPGVQPFVIERADQFRPPPPPLKTDSRFMVALDEIRDFGALESSRRTEEQTVIARFWSDFNYTSTPPGHWNEIARDVALDRRLAPEKSLRLFAVLNLALADAGLAAFDCKYHYNFWRPITAMHALGHPEWDSLLPAPSHPEYVSAHSTFSGAAARVLEAAFPGNTVRFSVKSDTLPGELREFTSFSACASEVGASRLYGGIHYGFSNQEGLKLGRAVAEAVLQRHPFAIDPGM